MFNRFTRITSILSIATILSGVILVSTTAGAYSPAIPEKKYIISSSTTTAEIANASYVLTPKNVPTLMPEVTRKYKHPSMHGYKKSVYTGKYYHKSQESFRKCVMFRESRNTYGSRNKHTSTAAGAYQFLDSQWRNGLSHMIYPELKKDYGKKIAKKVRTKLQKTPINKWSREMQDRAFFTALNYENKWSGRHHWNETVPGTTCNL